MSSIQWISSDRRTVDRIVVAPGNSTTAMRWGSYSRISDAIRNDKTDKFKCIQFARSALSFVLLLHWFAISFTCTKTGNISIRIADDSRRATMSLRVADLQLLSVAGLCIFINNNMESIIIIERVMTRGVQLRYLHYWFRYTLRHYARRKCKTNNNRCDKWEK